MLQYLFATATLGLQMSWLLVMCSAVLVLAENNLTSIEG